MKAELDPGADVMARRQTEAFRGQTPLHFAAKFGAPEDIQFLLDAGADEKAITGVGNTVLNQAAETSQDPVYNRIFA